MPIKTKQEWIKFLQPEVTGKVLITEHTIGLIQLDALKQGMTDAVEILKSDFEKLKGNITPDFFAAKGVLSAEIDNILIARDNLK